MSQNKQAIAVLISDIHYNINTLDLADKSIRLASQKACSLNVPLVVAGDLHDTKAIIRAECANRMLNTFNTHKHESGGYALILIGNHCKINNRGEEHALNFLGPVALVMDYPRTFNRFNFIPYQETNEKFLEAIQQFPKGTLVICHQGFRGAHMGDYAIDHSSVDPADVKDWRVISGHYHRRQDIGTISYIGNPYTLSFGEANDPPKGFQVLYNDGSLEFIPTNLRKHAILELTAAEALNAAAPDLYGPSDLLWVKVSGPYEQLKKINKEKLGNMFIGHSNFKLDLLPDSMPKLETTTTLTGAELMDKLVDNAEKSVKRRKRLKKLWRDIADV